MKNTVEVVLVRINDEVINSIGIVDCYTSVQIYIPFEKLDEVAIAHLENVFYSEKMSESYYLGENEAKDVCLDVGNLKISTETVEICLK